MRRITNKTNVANPIQVSTEMHRFKLRFQHGACAAVKGSSEQEQSSPAHDAKKMRTDDDEMDILTVVHKKPTVPEALQVLTFAFWDEMTGYVLPPDLKHAAQETLQEDLFFDSTNSKFPAHRTATRWVGVNKVDADHPDVRR